MIDFRHGGRTEKVRHCGRAIHPERYTVAPRVTTCSALCAEDVKRERNRQAAASLRERKRQATVGDRGPLMAKPGFAIAPPPR